MGILLNAQDENQINQCIHLLKNVFDNDLLGIYLFGSAVIGGLQKYSDSDLFVILNRSSTYTEKVKLVENLLKISGVYQVSSKRPIEMTLVVKSEINPWHFPPKFDFQYGDWLRNEFENSEIEPWKNKEMPDIAILITQILLASKTVWGENPEVIFSKIPYKDFMLATVATLDQSMSELYSDTRNVLLTLARIWYTFNTDQICSKPRAATWAIHQLPTEYQLVMKHAKASCLGEENENWDEIKKFIEPCAQHIMNQINKKIAAFDFSNNHKSIRYADE